MTNCAIHIESNGSIGILYDYEGLSYLSTRTNINVQLHDSL